MSDQQVRQSVEFNELPAQSRAALIQAFDKKSIRSSESVVAIFAKRNTIAEDAMRAIGLVIAWVFVMLTISKPRFDSYEFVPTFLTGLVAMTLIAESALRAWEAMLDRQWPFMRGVYVLPWHVVDASSSRLVIYSLSALKEIRLTRYSYNFLYSHTQVRLRFSDGSSVAFLGSKKNGAETLQERLGYLRARYTSAAESKDTDLMLLLNPLQPMNSSLAPKEKSVLVRDTHRLPLDPLAVQWHKLAAILIGVAMSATLAAGLVLFASSSR